jgi:hypothetical protein
MTFQPIIPLGGVAGWQFLTRTMDTQKAAFNAAPLQSREVAYFKETIGTIDTAEQLVSDRRLLTIALGAFGLDDDINNTFFVKKILEDGSLDPEALGNKLADKRYLEFSKAFGFGDFGTPRTKLSTFGDEITHLYQEQQFEIAVGNQSENMRLALGLQNDLSEIAEGALSENGKWFSVLGNPPLRTVFETAFGLPSSFAQLDLDTQLLTLKDKANQAFGDEGISQFTDPEKMEQLTNRFLIRAEINGAESFSATSTALTLLQSSFGPASLLGL